MTAIATEENMVIYTTSGETLAIDPTTANPVSVDEMIRRRDAWYARNKHLLGNLSTDKFIAEKRRAVKAGLE